MNKLISAFVALFAASLLAQEITIPGSDIDLANGAVRGTLLMPKAAMAVPVVLIISGSGPTDRNGNSRILPAPNDSLKMVAEGLAAQGIASVRYDKRGIGASAKVPEAELRFDTYVDDAVSWCEMLKKDKRFSRVVIAGHSEGAQIGVLAAKRCGAAGVISLEGPGRRAGDILRTQLMGKLPPDLAEKNSTILKSLESGETVADVPQALMILYRPSVQPYLISWLNHDPAKAIAQLDVPLLIVQGTTDIQVGLDDAKRLGLANAKAKLLVIEGMNHVLKVVPADQQKQLASYSDATLPLAPQLIPAMVELVKATAAK